MNSAKNLKWIRLNFVIDSKKKTGRKKHILRHFTILILRKKKMFRNIDWNFEQNFNCS